LDVEEEGSEGLVPAVGGTVGDEEGEDAFFSDLHTEEGWVNEGFEGGCAKDVDATLTIYSGVMISLITSKVGVVPLGTLSKNGLNRSTVSAFIPWGNMFKK